MAERERDLYDWAHNYELIERAFDLWREGERQMRRSPWRLPSVHASHERAIALGVDLLRRYTTMQELLRAYYSPKYVDAGVLPDADANESWVDYVCRAAGAYQVSRAIIEDASYFRRARELIVEATEGV